MTSETSEWYGWTRDATARLVRARGVSPSPDEDRAVVESLRLLHEGGLEEAYTASGLDAVAGDPHGRHNAYAVLRGRSPRAVVLLGHVDTVGTADYGPLEPWALDPDGLLARHDALALLAPGLAEDLAARPGDWMLGRGVADMKSGVAAAIAVLRRLASAAREGRPPPLSVVLLATVDEENESAGILQGVRLLGELRDRYGLEYIGAINTDYTAARYPGDPRRYIYTGTVGKLLPSLYVVGQAAHAGDPFAGLDANLLVAELVRDLSMNTQLCDRAHGMVAPPPVTLRATDLKTVYDTQLPFAAHLYLNVVTLTTEPAPLLDTLRRRAETVLAALLARLDAAADEWAREGENPSPPDSSSLPTGEGARGARSGAVLTYAGLRAEVAAGVGEERVRAELADEWGRGPANEDKRERSLRLVRRLWTLSGRQGPAVVLYYAPPYYPHVAPGPTVEDSDASAPSPALHEAVRAVAAAHPELNLVVRGHFPLLSDLSYLRLDPRVDLAALRDNMPVWHEPDGDNSPPLGAYSLPLDAMRALDLPVANLGPYGRDVHQPGERVLMSYSFGALPQLIYETVEYLANQ